VSFLSVSDRLLAEYCGKSRACFWGYAGLIEPLETRQLYLFDCSLFNYVTEEHANLSELRVLLSFKAGLSPNDVRFGAQLEYPKLPEAAPCNVKDIESCLSNSFKALDAKIQEYASQVRPERGFLKRLFLPASPERSITRGRYYGLILRRRLLSEMAGNLGYVDGVLKSSVKPVYVLYSVDIFKWDFAALVGENAIRLGAHRTLIDRSKLLSALGVSLSS